MPEDRAALEHLLNGRAALVLEVERLTTAIEELDTVIGQIGGSGASLTVGTADSTPKTPLLAEAPNAQPVNLPAAREAPGPASPAYRRRAKATARKSAKQRPSGAAKPGNAPKSIRVHVLEMLASEDRQFGLTEIIDRVHGAGIQAHDDAVRSITIKLMKDGKVERVGRGQYTLTRRGPARSADAAPPAAPAAPDVPAPESSRVDTTPALNLGEPWEYRA